MNWGLYFLQALFLIIPPHDQYDVLYPINHLKDLPPISLKF